MVINTNFNNTSGASGPRSNKAEASSGSGPNSAKVDQSKNSDDKVNLSSEAQVLAQLESQIKSTPDVDAERVAQIKAAVEGGTYEFNAERVAQRMLDADSQF
ncbi:MAG: flagellar biosynthesis anti-sigma factor FlgM [Cellvibrionaceae bacterium]